MAAATASKPSSNSTETTATGKMTLIDTQTNNAQTNLSTTSFPVEGSTDVDILEVSNELYEPTKFITSTTLEKSTSAKEGPLSASEQDDKNSNDSKTMSELENMDLGKSTDDAKMLSYDNSEHSEYYILAKELLKQGDFEKALESIEGGIQAMRELRHKSKSNDDTSDIVLDEALAPFHYLYGTTLLYSVEEASDNQNVTNLPSGSETEPEITATDLIEAETEDKEVIDAPDVAEDENATNEEEADDVEIAWENLELARTVLERMTAAHPDDDKLKLDLAQVFLREGDLQRMNNRYEEAVRDYSSCLQYRRGNSLLDPYDRKLADVHYNLGLAYMMQVAERKTSTDHVAPSHQMNDAKLRDRAFYHFLQCGRTFCGQLALLCNLLPEEFLCSTDLSWAELESTNEEENKDDLETVPPIVASDKLRSLRMRVADLVPPVEHQAIFDHVRELLIEIQETIDEAQASEEGLHEVTEMKAEITAAVAEQAAVATDDDGKEVQRAKETTGFGSAAASAYTAAAKPILVVKKKKKRDADEANVSGSLNEPKRLNVSSE